MRRRDFLKLGGLTASYTMLTGCTMPRVPRDYVPYSEPPGEILPGVANMYATTCGLCPARCGMLARVIDGRAVKLEGNPADPVSRGKLCATGQANLQVLYHPDRLRTPLRRTGARGEGQFVPATWDEALAAVIRSLRTTPGSIDMLVRELEGSRGLVVDHFMRARGGRAPVVLELSGTETLRAATRRMLGHDRLLYPDLANARFVLNFGAEIFSTWGSPVHQGSQYGRFRRGRPGIRGTLVHLGPRMGPEGIAADRYLPLRPGSEGRIALALAQVIVDAGLAAPGFDGYRAALAPYLPETIAEREGVPARTLRELALAFAGARPALALVGGPTLAQPDGLAIASAIQLLNLVVGALHTTGGLMPQPPSQVRAFNALAPAHFREVRALLGRMQRGETRALLLHEADPAYLLPPAMGFTEALAKVPLVVSFSPFMDDTTAHADWVLPTHTALEAWGITTPEPGPGVAVLGSRQPVVAPVYTTRPLEDLLLTVDRALGATLPWSSNHELVQATWTTTGGPEAWTQARREGVLVAPPMPLVPPPRPTAPVPALAASPQAGGEFPLFLVPYRSPSLLDGHTAHLPWLQELPDPLTASTWSSWVELHPATAARLGLGAREPVTLTTPMGTLAARVLLNPGLHPEVVAMPMGQGHRHYTRYAAGRGANVLTVVASHEVTGVGSLAWAGTPARLSRAVTAPEVYLAERRDPTATLHGPGHQSLQELREATWPWDGAPRHSR